MIYSRIINEAKQNLGANSNLKDKARELRRNMTEPEKILWSHIRRRKLNGMYFRRQHPYGIYVLDFYCFEASLAIEIDGMIHLKRSEYDIERTRYLESSGLKVIRFKNLDVETKIDLVLEKISSYLNNFQIWNESIISPLGEIRKGVLNTQKLDLSLNELNEST